MHTTHAGSQSTGWSLGLGKSLGAGTHTGSECDMHAEIDPHAARIRTHTMTRSFCGLFSRRAWRPVFICVPCVFFFADLKWNQPLVSRCGPGSAVYCVICGSEPSTVNSTSHSVTSFVEPFSHIVSYVETRRRTVSSRLVTTDHSSTASWSRAPCPSLGAPAKSLAPFPP